MPCRSPTEGGLLPESPNAVRLIEPLVYNEPAFSNPSRPGSYLTTAAYTWQNVNIAAGGFVDGIFYDPHNAKTLFTHAPTSGGLFKSVNDGTNWSQLLDFVGNNTTGSGNGTQFQEFGVLSFAIDPENSNNLYAMVGEYSGTNGDVLYSTNAGATWSTTPLSFYVGGNQDGRGAGEHIAVDPYDSNIIFLGSNANGLWESTNAGHSFSQVTSFSSPPAPILFFSIPTPEPRATRRRRSSSAKLHCRRHQSFRNHQRRNVLDGSYRHRVSSNRMDARTRRHGFRWQSLLGLRQRPVSHEPANGGVFRFNISTGVWANISPVVPQSLSTYDYFGYGGLALDPNSPTTIVVTSLDATTTATKFGARPTPTPPPRPGQPYQLPLPNIIAGYRPHSETPPTHRIWPQQRRHRQLGQRHRHQSLQFHPDHAHLWRGHLGHQRRHQHHTLTAPNSWYFPDDGIEMTALLGMAASTGGTPLFSAMGDVGGFAFTTLAFLPTQGNVYANGGNGTSSTPPASTPRTPSRRQHGHNYGFYSTNGTTFSQFSSNPGGSSGYSNGTVAISANGSTIVWAPSGQAAYYSTNYGTSGPSRLSPAAVLCPTGGRSSPTR